MVVNRLKEEVCIESRNFRANSTLPSSLSDYDAGSTYRPTVSWIHSNSPLQTQTTSIRLMMPGQQIDPQ